MDVVFVNMPYGPLTRPSIGLGLLKAALDPARVSSKTFYFSIPFAELIGARRYEALSVSPPWVLMGEWTFSEALFPDAELQPDRYFDDIVRPTLTNIGADRAMIDPTVDSLREIRSMTSQFLDQCADQVLAERPAVVGFTSAFQQHVASLALARRLKERAPELFILFGGANCEQLMGAETIRRFPFVDAVVSGEADLVFVELMERVRNGQPLDDLPGVYTQRGEASREPNAPYSHAPMVREMDALPYPDFDEFFEQFNASPLRAGSKLVLLFETARGCWWGEKAHCTFCGLNGASMTYRSKSAQRALEEFAWLTERQPHCPVAVVDNILDMEYFKEFVPALAARTERVNLFYEVKTSMKKEQVRLMADAGIRFVQPGIESLSTPVLKLMKKGASAIQNLQFLKWCEEFGVKADWNMLAGFPGERPEEYERMAGLLPFLSHLKPPASEAVTPILLNRFSPHFNRAEEFGFTGVRAHAAYGHVYPFPDAALHNLAYYFEHDYAPPIDLATYSAPLSRAIARWREAYPASVLLGVDEGGVLEIFDSRPGAAARTVTRLEGLERELLVTCDRAESASTLEALACRALGRDLLEGELEAILAPLVADGFLFREGTQYLSLVVPSGVYAQKPAADQLLMLSRSVVVAGDSPSSATA